MTFDRGQGGGGGGPRSIDHTRNCLESPKSNCVSRAKIELYNNWTFYLWWRLAVIYR